MIKENLFIQNSIGIQKIKMKDNDLVKLCRHIDSSFEYLFDNKFLKYEYDKLDDADLIFLEDIIFDCLYRQIKGYTEHASIANKFQRIGDLVGHQYVEISDEKIAELRDVITKVVEIINEPSLSPSHDSQYY